MLTYKVKDMTCGGCAASIKRALAHTDAAAEVEVDLAGKLVRVNPHAADASRIEAAIRNAGFTPARAG